MQTSTIVECIDRSNSFPRVPLATRYKQNFPPYQHLGSQGYLTSLDSRTAVDKVPFQPTAVAEPIGTFPARSGRNTAMTSYSSSFAEMPTEPVCVTNDATECTGLKSAKWTISQQMISCAAKLAVPR
eukprot:SAG31_NODE_538_length_14312_cov_12.542461_18_plen_127_part_00